MSSDSGGGEMLLHRPGSRTAYIGWKDRNPVPTEGQRSLTISLASHGQPRWSSQIRLPTTQPNADSGTELHNEVCGVPRDRALSYKG